MVLFKAFEDFFIIILWWLLTLTFIEDLDAAIPAYCMSRFNSSDCKGTPRTVFYYYKPGSRCEMITWRGCPTLNKFENEVLCSHYCIAKFLKPHPNSIESSLEIETEGKKEIEVIDKLIKKEVNKPIHQEAEMKKEEDEIIADPCKSIFNDLDCGKEPEQVYIYDNSTNYCELRNWRGCHTLNMFTDMQKCVLQCLSNIPINKDKWIENINKLNDTDIEKVNDILNQEFPANIDNDVQEDIIKLTKIITTLPKTTMEPSSEKEEELKIDITTIRNTTMKPSPTTISVEDKTLDEKFDVQEDIKKLKKNITTLPTTTMEPSSEEDSDGSFESYDKDVVDL